MSVSSVLQVRFHFSAASKPHKENILSTDAWEAGAVGSSASDVTSLYDVRLAVQNSNELSIKDFSTSVQRLCSSVRPVVGPLRPCTIVHLAGKEPFNDW